MRAPQVREHALAPTFCAEAPRPVQDPDLDSLRLRNPLQGYHWLELVRQSCMTSRSATRRFRAWHSCPERELLPFRPLLQHGRLDGKPPGQGLLERDSRSGSRSSVHCSDDGSSRLAKGAPPQRLCKQRSAPCCWIHHQLVFHSHSSFRNCTTPRKGLCGAFFLSKSR